MLGLAACLVNPQHVFVFQLPPQLGLGGLSAVLSTDSYLASLFLSPFNPEFFRLANISVAALAYLPLILLGLVSFALEFRNLAGGAWCCSRSSWPSAPGICGQCPSLPWSPLRSWP